jgi:hypothetical protein
MRKYKLNDGGTIQAESPCQFVTELRLSSRFDSDCSDEEYMKNFAERYKVYCSEDIRFDKPENFVADLRKSGYIVDVD